ncbi:hypothetical protein BH11VER1_BH11VER1_01110 [soil metagenome]
MTSAGMVLGCTSIVRRVVGMLGITDRVNIIAVSTGVRCLMGGFAGMIAVVRSVVARFICTRMIVFVVPITSPQWRGNEG